MHHNKTLFRAEGRLSTATQSESASKHGQEQEMVKNAPTTTGARQGETEFSMDPNTDSEEDKWWGLADADETIIMTL